MVMFGLRCARKTRADDVEREKLALLEQAEQDVRDLTERAQRATTYLDARRKRNHFAECLRSTVKETS